MRVNLMECKAAKVDAGKVRDLAKRLSACGLEAQRMGLVIFGSGEGRIQQLRGDYPLVVAYIDGAFDGGAGIPSSDGPDELIRGE
jgi:hypothetical protein